LEERGKENRKGVQSKRGKFLRIATIRKKKGEKSLSLDLREYHSRQAKKGNPALKQQKKRKREVLVHWEGRQKLVNKKGVSSEGNKDVLCDGKEMKEWRSRGDRISAMRILNAAELRKAERNAMATCIESEDRQTAYDG